MKRIVAVLLALLIILIIFAAYLKKSSQESEELPKYDLENLPALDDDVIADNVPGIENNTPMEEDSAIQETVKEKQVALHNLPVITKEASFREASVSDAYGNSYEGPYYDFCSWGNSRKEGEYITQSYMEYRLDGQYRYLVGTIFTRAQQLEEHSIELLVYADDVLVFQSEPLARRDKALELAVDIGYCDVLRIASRSYEYTSTTNPGIILVDGAVCNSIDGELTEGVKVNPDLVPLTSLHVYGDHSRVLDNISVGVEEDSYGNVYKGIYMELVSYGNYGGRDFDTQAYTDFVTNGEYNYFSGTFFARPQQSETYTIEFLIYADDKLVYSSGMIDRSTKAIDFCVDIRGCEILRVMSRSVNYTVYGTNPGIILIDPVVSTKRP